MLSVYPYASGSLYVAAYTTTSSYATKANFIGYVISSSTAVTVLYPQSGSRGKSVCLLTTDQYLDMVATGKMELCNFSS